MTDRRGERSGEMVDAEWVGVARRLECGALVGALVVAAGDRAAADVIRELTRMIGGPPSEPAR